MKQLIWVFQFLLVVLFAIPLAVLPYRISLKFGEVLGSLLFHAWSKRREIALENLRSAIARNSIITDSAPESIIKQNFRNLGKSLVEITKIYYGLGSSILENVEIKGIENLERASKNGRGLLIITGHCGNWELNAITLSMNLARGNVVARPLNNPYLNRIVEKARGKYGNRVIYKKGALKKILSALKKNEAVGILMDQSVIKAEGVIINFLGKKAYTMKMPAMIARKCNSPVLPVFIKRVNGGHILEIGREIELDKSEDSEKAVLNDTIKFTGYIEEYIKKNPSEWLWIHRRWKRIKE